MPTPGFRNQTGLTRTCLTPSTWVLQLPVLREGAVTPTGTQGGHEAPVEDRKDTSRPAQSWGGPRAWKSSVKLQGVRLVQGAPSPPLPGADTGLGPSVLCVVFSVQLNKTCPALFLKVWWFVTLAFHPWSSGVLGEEVESAPVYRPPCSWPHRVPSPLHQFRGRWQFSYQGGGCLGDGKVTLRGVLGMGE